MKARDLFGYALRALRGHRLRAVLSLLGVAIGVASVILLTSLGEGARLYVTGEFANLGTNIIILLPGRTETHGAAPLVNSAPHDLTVDDLMACARAVPQIARVAPIALGTARATYGDRARDIIVIGTTHEMLAVRHLSMRIGRYLPEGEADAPVCVLGATTARELFRGESPLGELVRIGDQRFRVLGVIASRGTSIGQNMDDAVHIPVETALRMYNRTSLFRAMIETRRHDQINAVRDACISLLKARHDNEEDVTVITQDAVLATFNQILRILTAALAGIAAVSLSVAGIGIMNVMLVTVSERTREIGLMKAVGVTEKQITAVFLVEAAAVSSLGGLVGLLLGLLGGRVLRFVYPDFPIQPPLWAVVLALSVSLVVGLIFGSIPARRAAGLDPVEALMRRRA